MQPYDVAVLGGGPAGYAAGIAAARRGMKAAVIEADVPGGTCLNRGCIPTKALLHAAGLYQQMKECARFGLRASSVDFDYAAVAARRDSVVAGLRRGVESLIRASGCELIRGYGRLAGPGAIAVDGTDRIAAKNIILATGSQPARPRIAGIDGPSVFDSDGALAWTACPDRIVIIGGGVIGVEFATLFHALDRQVTILELTDTLLPGFDADIQAALRKSLEKRGVAIHTGTSVTGIEPGSETLVTYAQGGAERHTACDAVICAAGRRPRTGDTGLGEAGIQTVRGFIRTDAAMRTGVPGIYAAGDITGGPQLAHAATAQALTAVADIAGDRIFRRFRAIPACVYTSPEIASVGLTEAEARQRFGDVAIGSFPAAANGRAAIAGVREGFAKIIADRSTGEILGAHVMAPAATDMIAGIAAAMGLEATLAELSAIVYPHPTFAEMLGEAAHDVEGMSIHKI